ncbi:MAG: hypothetical protein COV29_00490 [Candidatus Yanofskybacteria bacterium CG10_big_fil_rev_8_21_14_0_10_36_16]|uniref:Excinuclease ABC subunit C n=1 Tax=Candidatus Yanofskybacteria bacterium CG10_big_fil_rev_8_21_14_0_10_36_16 TaxID=1975096 RepID=A0A2J0Q8B3_9BACT|nr:MAG: hypothetical protein COV29_00490 [Candidatus Yanofskybacteria bacterium CG10_big_fil_rev_8_21_14_0_10_36_16]
MKIDTTSIPNSPGVYFFKGRNGQVLYIGKASNLKNRLNSYKKNDSPRIEKMVELAEKIKWQETDSEIEALILESQLIKKQRPKFNIMLRDDKQYFYIGFSNEEFPQIYITHQPQNPKFKNKKLFDFLGPFTDGTALKISLRLLRKIFPYCNCKQKHNNYCLNYHIGNCLGICCIKNPESKIKDLDFRKKEYIKNIKAIRDVLSGKKDSVIKKFKKEVQELSKNEKFEEAEILQNKVHKLEKVFENSQIVLNSKYLSGTRINQNHKKVLNEAKKSLGLSSTPFRIEGYDIANIQGEYAVGAMIVFKNGRPDKTQYKKFKIKKVSGANDIAMLKEILERRFKHNDWAYPELIIVDGGKAQFQIAKTIISNSQFFISNKVQDAENKIFKPTIIALTKNKKHKGIKIYINEQKNSTHLTKLPPAVKNLILTVNAEAHRFAINYYRKLHRKSMSNL